ncbi:MAG TPA: DUF4157 domain-containing protein [Verrucomicrobiae bacterium]|nr:DUF4157 domain-containing protein [Verrucomicrobiae bacterium]HTZ56039.1 DUF4157 domain-containing protein [Candidatus Acidoferrum sp.]
MEKIVTTLGEQFAREAERLVARLDVSIPWLELGAPMIARCCERSGAPDRFQRHDAVPHAERERRDEPEELPFEWPDSMPLPPRTRDELRDVVGPAVDVARVHVGEQADAFARKERADAVTVGPEMYFRAGAYAPHDPQGFALLTHEVTHVAEWLRPGAAWRRATDAGVRAEERLAHRREHAAVSAPFSPALARLPAVPALKTARSTAPRVATQSSAQRPMRAEMDRAPIDAPAPPSADNPNLDMMRRTLFRDLMNEIRVEFERGA